MSLSLTAAWASAWEPPPDIQISDWAEAHRRLPETSAARGARWSNASVPYLRGMMDACREAGVRKVAWMKCHQSAGSTGLDHIIGYHIAHDPCPILMVFPTDGDGEGYSKDRLADMIRSTDQLAAVVRDRAQPRQAAHQAESTLSYKVFPGGFLTIGSSKSPNTFARISVRLAIGDDVDRWAATVGEEGDPVDLMVNRTTSFYDALSIFVSTPVLKGGRIDTLYGQSDKRRYFVTCGSCGREDWITWSDPEHFRVGYDGESPATARLECPCGARWGETERRRMVSGGEWRATAEAKEPGLVGFHLPAMVSTLGDVTLENLVAKWLSARRRGQEALKVFINTSLAEGWEERGARRDAHTFLARRENYGEGVDVPGWAPCLTAGVDVQIDRFELQVIGWGPGEEKAVVDVRSIPGDPKRPETQAALLEALQARYQHESGHMLPIHAVCVDSGYATDEVYDFVLAHQHRGIVATKGFAGRSGEPIVGKPSERSYGRRARAVRLYPINVDDAKADVYASLAITEPGPRYIHFPQKVDEDYFAQLCAEHREARRNKAGVATHMVWVQDRERNEALDTFVLALAAFRRLRPNLKHMADQLASTPVPGKDGGSRTPPSGGAPPAPPRSQRQPTARSSYLGR